MKEIWKDVIGYEGIYMVSSLGRVKSSNFSRRRTIIILKPGRSHNGYLFVNLKGRPFRVHRLVAQAFIDNSNNKPFINHIDAIRDNNNVNNLEWCTSSENAKHAFKLGRRTSPMGLQGRIGKMNPLSKKVSQLTREGNLIKVWDSISDVRRELGFIGSNISCVCKGRMKTYKNFKWEYYGGS
jgi:hypothetical protein